MTLISEKHKRGSFPWYLMLLFLLGLMLSADTLSLFLVGFESQTFIGFAIVLLTVVSRMVSSGITDRAQMIGG